MFDCSRYQQKPDSYETSKLQRKLKPVDIEIAELAKEISYGCTWKPALLGGTTSDCWCEQTLFALDFDYNTTIQDELARCTELTIFPCFGYTSFRHTEDHHRFRLVFCNNKAISDRDTRDRLQSVLIGLFTNSDKVTIDPARLFYGGKTLIETSYDNTIDGRDIIDKYGHLAKAHPTNSPQKNKVKGQSDLLPFMTDTNENIENIKKLDVNALKSLCRNGYKAGDKVPYIKDNLICRYLYPTPSNTSNCNGSEVFESTIFEKTIVHNRAEMLDAIHSIDLNQFLGVGDKMFSCLFHSDNNPSAHIIQLENGEYLYKCFSDQCEGRAFTIVTIVEKLAKCTRLMALDFIKTVYDIELIESDSIKYQKERIQSSIDYVLSGKMQIEYPTLYSRIKYATPELITLLTVAAQYICDENSNCKSQYIFYCSLRAIQKMLDRNDVKKTCNRVNLLAFLDIINKIREEDIPPQLLSEAKKQMAQHGLSQITNFYSVNSFDTAQLERSNEYAKLFQDSGLTMGAWSWELLYRTFGPEIASRVYPGIESNTELSKTSRQFEDKLHIQLSRLLEKQGYFTEAQLISKLKNKKLIKRMLPELRQTYGLQRVKANKQMKEKHKISDKGYPYLYIQDDSGG